MFNLFKTGTNTPLAVQLLRTTSPNSTTIVDTTFSFKPRIISQYDQVHAYAGLVDYLALKRHCGQANAFTDTLLDLSTANLSHGVSVSQKTKLHVYMSSELNEVVTSVVVSSTKHNVFTNPEDTDIDIIDNVPMIYVGSMKIEDWLSISVFTIDVGKPVGNFLVDYDVYRDKFHAQYKVNGDELIVYLS